VEINPQKSTGRSPFIVCAIGAVFDFNDLIDLPADPVPLTVCARLSVWPIYTYNTICIYCLHVTETQVPGFHIAGSHTSDPRGLLVDLRLDNDGFEETKMPNCKSPLSSRVTLARADDLEARL